MDCPQLIVFLHIVSSCAMNMRDNCPSFPSLAFHNYTIYRIMEKMKKGGAILDVAEMFIIKCTVSREIIFQFSSSNVKTRKQICKSAFLRKFT